MVRLPVYLRNSPAIRQAIHPVLLPRNRLSRHLPPIRLHHHGRRELVHVQRHDCVHLPVRESFRCMVDRSLPVTIRWHPRSTERPQVLRSLETLGSQLSRKPLVRCGHPPPTHPDITRPESPHQQAPRPNRHLLHRRHGHCRFLRAHVGHGSVVRVPPKFRTCGSWLCGPSPPKSPHSSAPIFFSGAKSRQIAASYQPQCLSCA
jgi:hypothetical protein